MTFGDWFTTTTTTMKRSHGHDLLPLLLLLVIFPGGLMSEAAELTLSLFLPFLLIYLFVRSFLS